MAQKKFKQFFARDFGGIDGESSALEEDRGNVNRAVNYEFAVSNSLRGRLGCQSAGDNPFFEGLFTHSYTRTQDQYDIVYQAPGGGAYPNQTGSLATTKISANGASINKLVGINRQLWTLDNLVIPITKSAGTNPITWYTYVSGSDVKLNIKANGVSVLDTAIGTALSQTIRTWDLLNTIDATANFAVARATRGTCPPFAIVNGNQDTAATPGANYVWGLSYVITVLNTPHNFYPGDTICFCDNGDFQAGIVVARSATTITYVGPPVVLIDAAILGYLGQSASGIEITTAQSASPGIGATFNLTIPYWRYVPEGDASNSLKAYGEIFKNQYIFNWQSTEKSLGSFYAPATSTNSQGDLFIASTTLQTGTVNYDNNLIKYDGLQPTKAGLPRVAAITVAVNGAGGALTGLYSYKAFYRYYDAQGNIIEGQPSPVVSFTFAAQSAVIATVITDLYGITSFQKRSCYKYTAEAPAGAFFYVDDNSAAPGRNAFIQPGDVISLTDNTAQKVGLFRDAGLAVVVGQIHRTRCTAYDGNTVPSSIRVADTVGFTIQDNAEISTGLTVVFLRTAAGGNTYYELCEMPITGFAQITFRDNVTDAVLTAGTQHEEAVLGKEHNPPPSCSLVCQHQGTLVVARGLSTPNTVSFSTIDGIEYFPTASNSFDVPSTQSGFVTAIASDTNDRLAVFKERAYYDIVGDLDGGNFSVNVRNEGDYGIASQGSLIRIQDSLIGLSKNGFIVISNGLLSGNLYNELNARIKNQNYYFEWAVAVNDSYNRKYICAIPDGTNQPPTFIIDYSRDKIHTFELQYPTLLDCAQGMTLVGEAFYFANSTVTGGVLRRLRRFNGDSPSGNGNGDSFIDDTQAISYILESSVINNGEPDVLNTPVRLRTWSIPNDYVVDGWVPFAALVATGASPIASYIGGTSPGATSSTITFATANDVFKDLKLVPSKTHFYIVRFTTNTIRTAPFITGYEILYAESYVKEDLIK